MAYRLKHGDTTVADGLRRIATEQIDTAIAEVDDGKIDRNEAIHQVRKRCKKLRGLIRLMRPCFDGYARENETFRDAARSLSGIRDTEAVIESYDALVGFYADQVDRKAFASVRRRLTMEQKHAAAGEGLEDELARFRATMVKARARAVRWEIDDQGFGTIAGGLAKTYKRARKAMGVAVSDPTIENIHEWRKRVKYHWYHARLTRPIWREVMEPHAKAAKQLSDILGDHHDLAVLRDKLMSNLDAFGKRRDVEAFLGLAAQRQAKLAAEAAMFGRKLLAEKGPALVDRWQTYWEAEQLQVASPPRANAA